MAADALVRAGEPPVVSNLAKDIAEARTGWMKESGIIRGLLGKLNALAPSLKDLESRRDKAQAEVRKLTAEKARALDEMRKGEFCSGCNKTRSQIEAEGDRFPHPGQQSLPPTPEQLKALEEDYDRRIAVPRNQRSALESEFRAKRGELDSAFADLQSARTRYHGYITREGETRRIQWVGEKTALEKQLAALKAAMGEAEKAVADATERQKSAVRRLQQQKIAQERDVAEADAEEEAARASGAAQIDVARKSVTAAEHALAEAERAGGKSDLSRLREAQNTAQRRERDAREAAQQAEAAAAEKCKKAHAAAGTIAQALEEAQRGDALRSVRANFGILEAQFRDSLRQAQNAQARTEQDAAAFVQTALRNLDETSKPAESLPQAFGLPSGLYLRNILREPTPAVSCAIIPLRHFEGAIGGQTLRDRLEAGRPPPPANPTLGAGKSMKDFLEQR